MKALIKIIVVLAIVVVGLGIYAKYYPASRVGGIVNNVQRALPQLFATGHANGDDLIAIGKEALHEGDRNAAKEEGKTTVYKWRTPSGDWTFGNAPPPGVQAVPVEVDMHKANRMSQ